MRLSKTAKLASCATGACMVVGGFFLIAPLAYGAQEQCSAAKLQGHYVFTGQGINLHYGAFDFDARANSRASRPRCATRSRSAKI